MKYHTQFITGIVFILAMLAGVAITVSADIINVPGEQPTIQAGLNIATPGDTVLVAAGTYTENIIWPDVNGIKLFGAGQENSIIDSNNQASVIRFETASIIDTTTIVRGFTITNGNALPPWPQSQGGGICIYHSSPILEYLNIVGNTADDFGGGIYIWGSWSYPIIRYCLIANNTALSHGGVECAAGSPVFDHVTVSGNNPGGIYTETYTTIVNSISASNGYYNLRVEGDLYQPTNIQVGYSDIMNGWQLIGLASVTQLGGIIDADPMFVNASGNNYHLQPNSPCIDAGDPTFPYDPDGTRTDMGSFYFDQSIAPDVSITMTPVNPPIVIPASGGSFDFTVLLENGESAPQTFDAWINAKWYTSQTYGPLLGPIELTLGANQSISRLRTQMVPGGAPGGNYTYTGIVGIYPDTLYTVSDFTFQKEYAGDGLRIDGWSNQGESFDNWFSEGEPSAPLEFALNGAYPNPFNPVTTIGFQLSAVSHVNLAVYDVSGRKVAELVNGWREAGMHEVTFDAKGLASGIYFYHLDAGQISAVGKMMLVK